MMYTVENPFKPKIHYVSCESPYIPHIEGKCPICEALERDREQRELYND